MDSDKLRTEITTLLGIVKIPEEEKQDLRTKLETSTPEQLEALKDNLLRQATADIYLDFLDELGQSDEMLDEDDEKEIMDKLESEINNLQGRLLTTGEIENLKQQLATLTKDLHAQHQAS